MKVDYQDAMRRASEATKLIDSVLAENTEVKLQAALDRVYVSAAPGPANHGLVCFVANGETEETRHPECTAKHCQDFQKRMYFGDHEEAELFMSYGILHVYNNLKYFPDIYGDSLYGMRCCPNCGEAIPYDSVCVCELTYDQDGNPFELTRLEDDE